MTVFLREYATSGTVPFTLYDPTGANIMVSASFQYGDVIITNQDGTETSATFLPIDQGRGYYINFSSSELSNKRLTITISDTSDPKTFLDHSFFIETYGTSASQHPDILNKFVDGVLVNTIFERLLSLIDGNIVRSGDTFSYLKRDNSTTSFTLSAGTNNRVRL